MRVYKTPEIRNVAVIGHGASGKTSLVDALAFVAGTSKRHGSVKDGTALTDYTADEIERKYSINLALAVAEWMDTKINLIDTPGYLDFTGDALAGVYAATVALALCQGVVSPAASGLVSVYASPNEQGTTLGAAQALGALGRTLGPEAIGGAYDAAGARAAFLAAAGVMVVAWLATLGLERQVTEVGVTGQANS